MIDELRAKLGSDTRAVKVTHYSKGAGIYHDDYMARVFGELKHHGIMWGAEGSSCFYGFITHWKKSPDLVICMKSISWFIVIES